MPKNIVIFGGPGVGKTSIATMLSGTKAELYRFRSSSLTFQTYTANNNNNKYRFYDTTGFDESCSATDITTNIVKLIKSLKESGGVHLLILVVKKGQGQLNKKVETNYKLFIETITSKEVPCLLVITHCEKEVKMGDWWEKEKGDFLTSYKMKFVSTISGCMIDGEGMAPGFRVRVEKRYRESRSVLMGSLAKHSLALDSGCNMGDWIVWCGNFFATFWKQNVKNSCTDQELISALVKGGFSQAVATQVILENASDNNNNNNNVNTKKMGGVGGELILRTCLETIGCGVYTRNFIDNGIDFESFKTLTNEQVGDLIEGKIGPRNKIYAEIERIRAIDAALQQTSHKQQTCQLPDLVLPTTTSSPTSKNVVIFGGSGVGKSSLVNMLAGKVVATISDGARGCTLKYKRYESSDRKYCLFDTAGFDEGNHGAVSTADAVSNVIKLLKSLKTSGGVHLLVYVIKKGRITKQIEENYKLFVEIICMKDVPTLLVITNCEGEGKMGDWWRKEEHNFQKQYKMSYAATISACTSVGTDAPEAFKTVMEERYQETKLALMDNFSQHSLETGWEMKDWVAWFKIILVEFVNMFRRRFKRDERAMSETLKNILIGHGLSEKDAVKLCNTICKA